MLTAKKNDLGLLHPLPQGISIYRGSEKTRSLASQVLDFLRKSLDEGENLRFRNINDLYAIFDEKRCVYATDLSNNIVGFYCFNLRKNCVILSTFVVAPHLRNHGVGKCLRNFLLNFVRKNSSDKDIISLTTTPTIVQWNQEDEFQEITYRKLWEIYGINLIKECENIPQITCKFLQPFSDSIFDNVQIVNIRTGDIFKCMVLNSLK